jgi:hypothetical protein
MTAAHVWAADAAEKPASPGVAALPPVTVSALRDPVEKSYRKIVRGMELFERKRSLAPHASLRFKLLPRHRDTNMEAIALSIVSDNVNIPVPVAADNTFALERSPQALKENALVVPNRKQRTMTWRADIRTPDLPPDTRRLGDLRLECLVGMEADLVSNARSMIDQIIRAIADRGYCEQREPHYLFFAERPLWSVTLVHGTRREVLPVDQLYAGISRDPMGRSDFEHCDCEVLVDRTYYAPLGDASWPDETLLEFEYMEDGLEGATRSNPTAPQGLTDSVAIGKSTKSDVLATLEETLVIRFHTGYEVWVYGLPDGQSAREGRVQPTRRGVPDSRKAERSGELVILFAPSGVVAKTRVRFAPPP